MSKSLGWGLAAILTFGVRTLLGAHPDWTERYYVQGIYPVVRRVLDSINGHLPFPLFYLVVAGLLFGLMRAARFIFAKNKYPWQEKAWKTARGMVMVFGMVYVLFHWLWGFNYERPGIEEHLQLEVTPLSLNDLKAEMDLQTRQVLALRNQLQPDSSAQQDIERFVPQSMPQTVQQAVAAQLASMGLPVIGQPKGRQPFWKGFLLRFGAAGIYNPFTGECNTDKGLPALTQPYTLAHEYCHGYGFGDEGACNFLAYQALADLADPALSYSAALAYWRELAHAYRGADPEGYKDTWASLPNGFKDDLKYIQQTIDLYPEYFEWFRVKAYDSYLKAQGIEEGMGSYGKVIALNLAYRRKSE